MNISITFRHMEPSEAIKRYANGKLAKIQKFLRQPMTAKVTLSIDQLEHVAEARISSGGAHLEAKEVGEDMYASIDSVLSKLERQIRGTKGAAQARRKGAASVRTNAAAALAGAGAKASTLTRRSTSKKKATKKSSSKSSR
jgi:putative sigma-54 modulation protein